MGDLPRLAPRLRVVERLDDAVDSGLTVITAPAGFGKSVLLDQWVAAQAGRRPVARLTLHPTDDASLIAARLTAALDSRGGLGSLEDVVIVVDPLDAPTSTATTERMSALVERATARLHVVAACRSRSSTRRLCPRTDPVYIDETDLAFTPGEARLLLHHLSGREVNDRQLDALLAKTEGWAVGLQLAGIALRHAADPDAVVDAWAGDDPYVAGYLHAEVLDREPGRVRRFLTHTAVLDQLSGPLCDAVTGNRDGAEMLHRLEERGLFTRRAPPGDTYIYHPLFRDLLRRELRLVEPDAEAILLARAATWYLARHEPEPAAHYLIEAGDWDRLIELVDWCGRRMLERGAALKVLRWLDAIPGSEQRRRQSAVRRAYIHTRLGNTRLAAQIVHDVDVAGLRPGEKIAVNALRATWAFWDASPQSVIRAADAALGALDRVDAGEVPDILGLTSPASLRMMAAGSRARALWYRGDTSASRRALLAFLRSGDADAPWRAHVLGGLALLEAWAGNLRVAHQRAREALILARRARLPRPATIDARLALAHVSRERGHLQPADALLNEVHAIATRSHLSATLAIHAIERALWHLAAGDPQRGSVQIERRRASGDPPPPHAIEGRIRFVEVRLLLACGQVERAQSIIDAQTHAGALAPDLAPVAVEASIARGDIVAARTRLDAWAGDNLESAAQIERELWTAIVDAEAGDRCAALERLTAVVTRAQAEGHIRLFLDAGRPAERLLRDLLHTAPTSYLRQLVLCADQARRAAARQVPNELSERELEVARYLPTPLSNIEIAAQLYISLNTLKTHLQAIYRKLGVSGRREAIRRAEDLGIA